MQKHERKHMGLADPEGFMWSLGFICFAFQILNLFNGNIPGGESVILEGATTDSGGKLSFVDIALKSVMLGGWLFILGVICAVRLRIVGLMIIMSSMIVCSSLVIGILSANPYARDVLTIFFPSIAILLAVASYKAALFVAEQVRADDQRAVELNFDGRASVWYLYLSYLALSMAIMVELCSEGWFSTITNMYLDPNGITTYVVAWIIGAGMLAIIFALKLRGYSMIVKTTLSIGIMVLFWPVFDAIKFKNEFISIPLYCFIFLILCYFSLRFSESMYSKWMRQPVHD